MIKSMTGFGRATYENEGREYVVEIKTLNHKYNDISIKLNRNISYLEDFVRKTILEHISRGKIEVHISFADYSNTEKEILINESLVDKYIHDLKKITQNNNIIDDISIMKLLQLPDVFTVKNNLTEDIIKNEIEYVMGQALDNIIKMRKYEGEKIAEDIKKRINAIQTKIEEISELSTGLIDKYIVKLKDRIKKVLTTDNIDKNILEQEVVLYADKTSIEEEITRLNSHCKQFIKLLDEEANIGKKLDFLTQEMNREINTIASKANCLDITKIVIDVKTEIENIREQVQNVE